MSPHQVLRSPVSVVAALALIGWATLRPVESSTSLPAWCIICGDLGSVDFLLNIGLFVPLGVVLASTRRFSVAVLAGFAVTVLVESLQWRLIPGRDASLGDILANTLGAVTGAGLARQSTSWLRATGATAQRLAWQAGALTSLVVLAAAGLLRPARVSYPVWVQWTVPRAGMDVFRGTLASVDVNGTAIRPAEELSADRWESPPGTSLFVRATIKGAVAPSVRPALLVRVVNQRQESFMLAQWGDAAVYRAHGEAARLRFRALVLGLDGALAAAVPGPPHDPTTAIIEARSDGRTMSLSRMSGPDTMSVVLRRSVGLAWTLVLPKSVAISPSWWWAGTAFCAALVLPVSFFSARSLTTRWRETAPTAPAALVLALASFAAAPVAVGFPVPPMTEVAGLALGVAAGWWSGRPSARASEVDRAVAVPQVEA